MHRFAGSQTKSNVDELVRKLSVIAPDVVTECGEEELATFLENLRGIRGRCLAIAVCVGPVRRPPSMSSVEHAAGRYPVEDFISSKIVCSRGGTITPSSSHQDLQSLVNDTGAHRLHDVSRPPT
eukprot:scaffold1891_cov362-Prasinococcus_capsulatus_cf.AAC.4